MSLVVERVAASNRNEAIAFLSKYEASSIFLLGNLNEHGPNLGSHPNSGNFKLVRQMGKVVAVFCLAHRGVILAESELGAPVFRMIASSCLKEKIPIRALIGDWRFSAPFWQYLKEQKIIKKELRCSKEVNYTLPIDQWKGKGMEGARNLEMKNFSEWRRLQREYAIEESVPQDLNEVEIQGQFAERGRSSHPSGECLWVLSSYRSGSSIRRPII